MKLLDDFNLCRTEFGLELILKLSPGWREFASRFPRKRLGEILNQNILLADSFLRDLKQKVELTSGEFGLMHLAFIPERAGIDLLSAQNCYISHNISQPSTNSCRITSDVKLFKNFRVC